jgi:hypothetical protein
VSSFSSPFSSGASAHSRLHRTPDFLRNSEHLGKSQDGQPKWDQLRQRAS